MNPRLKIFLVACGYILLFVSAIGAIILFDYLLEIFISMLHAFLLAKTSSEVLAFFGTLAIFLAIGVSCYGLHKLCSIFTEKITSSYQSFKNENSGDGIFSEVYNDPTIGLKDKILFFSIYLIYCIQLPFLYCASKVSELSRMLSNSRVISARICLVLINTILLIPVALLELIKYPLVKLFSPLGLNVKQFSFLFNVSDVGTGSQSVHTSSFEESVIKCAEELKQKFGTQSNALNKKYEDYINNSDELTAEQRNQLQNYLNFNNSSIANWQESKTGLTLTQTANLVSAAENQKSDVNSLLLMNLKDGLGLCPLGMFDRIIYSLSCLEVKNNFIAQLEPDLIRGLVCNATKRFFEGYMGKHYHKIKVLKENFEKNFDKLYSSDSKLDWGVMNDEAKDDISYTRNAIKEFVFKELYVKFHKDYGKHIHRGQIKQGLRESITDDIVDSAIYLIIDEVSISPTPPTYLERVKAFFGGHARSSAA
ncbi:hypothetical protein [Wolbachia endosymbiont (group A) of Andrena hattorfiana]|uniref:hypothetical protein n=1 Tax=Wolbachia endosymbiont (group A) of Andrena hattorfiana TaxID=2953977 RepID=UPI0021F81EC5|nr:hypothetical protein [Wolbachia endosymbiont (group A) of Andrena hattorfiana]